MLTIEIIRINENLLLILFLREREDFSMNELFSSIFTRTNRSRHDSIKYDFSILCSIHLEAVPVYEKELSDCSDDDDIARRSIIDILYKYFE